MNYESISHAILVDICEMQAARIRNLQVQLAESEAAKRQLETQVTELVGRLVDRDMQEKEATP